MKKHNILPTLIGMLLMSSFISAQNTEKISSSLQKEIIEELSRLIKKEYVLEEIGFKMSSHLDSFNNRDSRAEMDSEAFIRVLNQELRSVYVDKHLGVVNPDKFKQFQKMFGLDEGNHQNKREEHHSRPEQQSNHNAHGDNNGHESHVADLSKTGTNELAGSRVINRDGRTNIGLMKLSQEYEGSVLFFSWCRCHHY